MSTKQTCNCSNVCMGLISLIFGVLFLLNTTGVWPEFTFAKYWPVVFIVIGIHNLLCPCASGDCEDDDFCCDTPTPKSTPVKKEAPNKAIAKKTSVKKKAIKKTTIKKVAGKKTVKKKKK